MERGGRQPVSGAGSLPRAPHAQAGVGGARLPAAFPPPCPRGSCPLPSSPEREPLLAPAGGGKASSAREPSSPADTPPAPVADREAGGSSGALFGASLCWPKRGPGSQEGPRGAERLRWPSAASGAACRPLILGCGLRWRFQVTPLERPGNGVSAPQNWEVNVLAWFRSTRWVVRLWERWR